MKRIFAISDTHSQVILPPPGYDVTVHLGDFINYFSVGPTGEHADLYRQRFDLIRQHYTHVVCGNHERMFVNRFGEAPDLLPDVLTIQVEGIKLRASHYLALPRPGSPELPIVPEALLENLYRHVVRQGAQIAVYGHTHHQRYDVCQGCHLVDVGHGERGEAAEIIIDGRHVEVHLLPGSRENEGGQP